MTDSTQTDKPEGKRQRVRRLLIDPLEQSGMRFPKKVSEADAKRKIASLCDELAYLSDAALQQVRWWATRNGQGSARCFWPDRVSFLSCAHAFEPQRIEDNPNVESWFASRAGVEAAAVPGRLVAELRFWQKYLRPPIKDQERKLVADRAAQWAAQAEREAEKRSRNVSYDHEFLAAFELDERRAQDLLKAGRAGQQTNEKGAA
ncbi:hypothetical protein [Shimia ponticola]|uniref:hypothetical protein n=1 Tax=Shimia ponticola TaxID=2582893 RepID=UPI0011BD5789|nr:hypothetical protein [Shimia ponticola]